MRKAGRSPFKQRIDHTHEEICYSGVETSLGVILIACTALGIVAVNMNDGASKALRDLRKRFPEANFIEDARAIKKAATSLAAFVERQKPLPELALDMRGSEFQQKVWRTMMQIPMGETRSYAAVARMIGSPRAARAVGAACANCELSIIVPCHRVTRADGSLSGAPDWIKRQRLLLQREAARLGGSANH